MRNYFGFSALIFCLLPLTQAHASAKQDPVPDWLLTAAQQKLPAYSADTNAVVLLEDTTLTVAPDGTATEHVRRVVKILRPSGRDQAIVFVPFDKDSKILSLHAWSIGPDGRQYAVKDKDFIEVGYPGQGNFYEDIRARAANPPGRDPGGIVAYEYDQRMVPYVNEDTWLFQDDIPHLSQSFTLALPPGFTYGTVWAHAKATAPIELEHQRFRWQLDNISGIDLERTAFSPDLLALSGRMTVHFSGPGIAYPTTGTWQSVGEWYQHLASDRLAATPAITAKAQELTAGKTDFYDKAEAIGVFLQTQIRYFVIERGIGGNQPHFAGDIFTNRYGDCKDKATLLSAMLSSVGIHSTLVLVDSRRGVVDPDAPSIFGNHAIAAIEIPAGYNSPKLHSVVTTKNGHRYLIFDPTWDKTAFGQLEHNLQGGYGLLVEGPDSQVIQFPVLAPELNTIRRTATAQLTPDGNLTGAFTEKRFGDLSERPRMLYTGGDQHDQTEYLDHHLGEDFSSFTISNFKIQNAAELNKDLTSTYNINASRFGRAMGTLLMVRPRVFGTEDLRIEDRPRRVPINLDETMQEHDDFTIQLPAGYAVDELPSPVKLDLGFASYESASSVEGDKLHYTRTYTVRQVTLPADRYDDIRRLSGVIAADEQANAVLKKK